MPPRFAYWTILIDNGATAFRAHNAEDLLPTLHQLKRTNANVVMKWFSGGRLWDSPDAARQARQRPPKIEKRPAAWRPGGAHTDPRDRFRKKPDRDRFREKPERFGREKPDRFTQKPDRFGPKPNRFGPKPDRFGSRPDRFGAKSDRPGWKAGGRPAGKPAGRPSPRPFTARRPRRPGPPGRKNEPPKR